MWTFKIEKLSNTSASRRVTQRQRSIRIFGIRKLLKWIKKGEKRKWWINKGGEAYNSIYPMNEGGEAYNSKPMIPHNGWRRRSLQFDLSIQVGDQWNQLHPVKSPACGHAYNDFH
jgi:hypothetical protein